MTDISKKKSNVARLSVISNATLVIGKLVIGLLIGSISIISEAIHSAMDLIAAIIAFFAVRASGQPADDRHPYGHGKFENVSGVVEAILIFLAAGLIIFESIKKIIHRSELGEVGLGLVIMGVSIVMNVLVSRKLMKVAKETESIALEADALHLSTDVYTSVGVFVGLGFIKVAEFFKLSWASLIDPITAILVALLIIKEAYNMTSKALVDLLDVRLSNAEMEKISALIDSKRPNVIGFHKLCTRKAGSERHIDFHLVVPSNISVKDSHELCDQIENDLEEIFPQSTTVIHVEPCTNNCKDCNVEYCNDRSPKRIMNIPLSSPDITDEDIESVVQVLKTPNLSLGPKLPEFEKMIADYLGMKYAIAVNSGTSGLHLCIKALGIKEGDEVITTPFSFIASANCILFENAKPVFVDIDPNTLNIDVNKIEEKITNRTKAILAVDVFGHPCNWDKINEIAKKHNLKVIEDSCEAIGAEYKGKKAGTFGDCAVFAFYPNKQMTTGEGGIIVTNSEEIYKLCKSLRNQGRGESGQWLAHERLGYNYRLSDINCALGISQLRRLNSMLKKRESVAKIYNRKLGNIQDITIPYISDDVKLSWFVYVIRISEKFDRDEILKKLKERGIGCNNYFSPIHLQPFYRELFGYKEGDFPITEKVSKSTIALPFHNNLKRNEISYVCDVLKGLLNNS